MVGAFGERTAAAGNIARAYSARAAICGTSALDLPQHEGTSRLHIESVVTQGPDRRVGGHGAR